MRSEFQRYLVAGVFNTIVGYLAFLAAFTVLGLNAAFANVISYAVGLLSAYVVNTLFVFRESRHSARTVLRFLAGFGLAYAANFVVLSLLMTEASFPAEFAQVLAMGTYTVVFYLLNKYFIWAN